MHQDHNVEAKRDLRVARAILWTAALLVLVWASWGPVDRALFPEGAARADCEAAVFFSLDGGVGRDDPRYEFFYEDVVAPAIKRCADEPLGR